MREVVVMKSAATQLIQVIGDAGKQVREVVGEEGVEFAANGTTQRSDIHITSRQKQDPVTW